MLKLTQYCVVGLAPHPVSRSDASADVDVSRCIEIRFVAHFSHDHLVGLKVDRTGIHAANFVTLCGGSIS
jgi:hypothetical protein